MLTLFHSLTDKQKEKAVDELIIDSAPRHDFFLMITLAVIMATIGLILNSASIVIGSMLINPILSPILSLALGVTVSKTKIIAQSFYTVIKSIILTVVIATVVTLFFIGNIKPYSDEILQRTEQSIAFLIIAIVSGLAASFARIKPNLNDSLPGVAISVALMPPLAVVGIGIATLNLKIAIAALTLFTFNIFGIIFASMFIFSYMNLYMIRDAAAETLEEENKKILNTRARVEKSHPKERMKNLL